MHESPESTSANVLDGVVYEYATSSVAVPSDWAFATVGASVAPAIVIVVA